MYINSSLFLVSMYVCVAVTFKYVREMDFGKLLSCYCWLTSQTLLSR